MSAPARTSRSPISRGLSPTSSAIRASITFDTSRPDGAPQKLLDVSRMTALGWRAKISLREGIAAAYQIFSPAGVDAFDSHWQELSHEDFRLNRPSRPG